MIHKNAGREEPSHVDSMHGVDSRSTIEERTMVALSTESSGLARGRFITARLPKAVRLESGEGKHIGRSRQWVKRVR